MWMSVVLFYAITEYRRKACKAHQAEGPHSHIVGTESEAYGFRHHQPWAPPMSERTKDSRIEQIESTTIYALVENTNVENPNSDCRHRLYIGETTLPLSERLSLHLKDGRRRKRSYLHRYLHDHVDLEQVGIEALDDEYDTEAEAISDHDNLANKQSATEVAYERHDWTSMEVDVLEESDTVRDAVRRLGLAYRTVRLAMIKLDLLDRRDYTQLSEDEVREIWVKYHQGEELSYADLAEEYNVTSQTVGDIIRRDSHQDLELSLPPSIEIDKAHEKVGGSA